MRNMSIEMMIFTGNLLMIFQIPVIIAKKSDRKVEKWHFFSYRLTNRKNRFLTRLL